ncbi:MAG TPA: hypothetical protein VFW53_06840 [Gallionella sp.]|nr:hypothetical protein [Gallionella sp.]
MTLDAHAWSPPQRPEIVFDSLKIDGILSAHDFVAQSFAVALQGIRAEGSGKVAYSDGWHVRSKLSHVDMPLARLMSMLGVSRDLTGSLHVAGELGCDGNTLGDLKNNFHFSGNVRLKKAAYRLAAEFKQPLLFDEIDAHVAAQADRITVSALAAKLYDGKMTGNAVVTRNKSLLKADVWASNISMQPLVEALTNEVLFSGRMNGAATLAMHLDAKALFPENMRLDGNFHLRNGALSKLDLVQAVSKPGKIPERLGTTRFDDLTGVLNVDTAGLHFSKIQLASGSINASGRVDVSPALQLDGALDADIKGTAGLVSMPMVISGTINKPVVRPSGTALAGAAVGTAILGPGVGTALGVRIGGFLNKVLGGQEGK